MRTLTAKPWELETAVARRRLKRHERISVRGPSPSRQAVIHKTLRQGCALGSASTAVVSTAQLLAATCGRSRMGLQVLSCRGRMEHVIIAREGSVLSCGRMYRGSRVAFCPRGGRGEMADRTNEVELGAWRRGRVALGMLLDDIGTFIPRTLSAALYINRSHPRPRVDEARLVVKLVFIWPILWPRWECLFSDTRGSSVRCHMMITWRGRRNVAYNLQLAYAQSFLTFEWYSISFVGLLALGALWPVSQRSVSWAELNNSDGSKHHS